MVYPARARSPLQPLITPARRAALLVAAIIAVAPLVVDVRGHHRFVAARFAVLAGLVAAAALYALVQRSVVFPRHLGVAWVTALVVGIVAAVHSPDPVLGLLGDTTRAMGVASAVLACSGFLLAASTARVEWRVIVDGLLVGASVVVLVGLAQMTGAIDHVGRPTATMGNAGFLGAYLCLVIPVAVSRGSSEARLRWPTIVLSVAAVVVLVGTQTRGAWIGTAVGLAVLLVLTKPGLRAWAAAAGVVVAVVIAAAALPVQGARGGGRFDLSSGTVRGRVDSWRVAASAIADRPMLGWGPEGLRRGFAENMGKDWVERYGLEQLPDRAHNRFIDVAASTGVAGLIVDVWLIALVVALGRRSIRAASNPSDRAGLVGVAAGLVAWLTQGQFLFDTFDLALVAWILAGALASTVSPRSRDDPTPTVVAALLVVGAVVSTVVAVNGFRSDRALQHASGSPSVAVAYERVEDAANLHPRSLDAYLIAGALAVASNDVEVMQRAHLLLDGWHDDEVRLADARLLRQLGRRTGNGNYTREAAEVLRDVLTRRPNDIRVNELLAAIDAVN